MRNLTNHVIIGWKAHIAKDFTGEDIAVFPNAALRGGDCYTTLEAFILANKVMDDYYLAPVVLQEGQFEKQQGRKDVVRLTTTVPILLPFAPPLSWITLERIIRQMTKVKAAYQRK